MYLSSIQELDSQHIPSFLSELGLKPGHPASGGQLVVNWMTWRSVTIISLGCWLSGNVIAIDQEVQGTIPGSYMGFYSGGELFHVT